MGAAFKSFFTALTTLFTAFNRLASAINHLCAWGDETAGSFYDEALTERRNKANAKEAELLAAPTPVAKTKARTSVAKPAKKVIAA